MEMRFDRVANNHAYRSIVDEVTDAILRGDLRKGDRLPSERDLAEQTGLSRSSVRQAMEVLSEAGVISVSRGSGGGAKIIDDLVPTELIGQVASTSTKHLLEVCEVRNMLEIDVAKVAVARATDEQIADLESIIQRTEASVCEELDNKEKWLRLDLSFHYAIVRMTGNEFLLGTYSSILRRLIQIADMANMEEFADFGPPSMRLFLEALRSRDPLGVQMAMYEHVYPSSRILQRYHRTSNRHGSPTVQFSAGQ